MDRDMNKTPSGSPRLQAVEQGEDLPEVTPNQEHYPELSYEDYPEVVSHDLPEVLHKDDALPEVKEEALPEVVQPPKQRGWWKRHWIWLAIAALVIIGAVIGGVVGGTRHKSNSQQQQGTVAPIEDAPPAADQGARTTGPTSALQTTPYPIPTAVSWAPGRIDVFGKTKQQALWHRAYANGSWDSQFEMIRNNLDWNTNIAALSRATDTLDVFFIGRDNASYQKAWEKNQKKWVPDGDSAWTLAGYLVSTIEAVWWSEHRIDMFAIDSSRKLVHQFWNESGWSTWQRAAGDGGPSTYLYSPTAVIWGQNRGYVFVVDEKTLEVQQSMWMLNDNNETVFSTAFQRLGGRCTSRPSAVAWADSRIDLVCRSADARVAWTTYNGSNWTNWTIGGNSPELIAEPHILSYAKGQLDVIVKSKDSAVRIGFYTAGSKVGWQWFLIVPGVKGSPRAVNFGDNTNPRTGAFIYAANDSLLYLSYNRTSSTSAVEDFQSSVQDLGLSAL